MKVKEIFGSLTNFIIFCIIVGIFSTQIIFTFVIPPTNWMMWQLMVVVFSSNLVAVFLGVYGYRSVEKKSLFLERTPEFQDTLIYISMISKVIKEHFKEGEEEEEFKEMVELVATTLSKYLKGKKSRKAKLKLEKLSKMEPDKVYEIVEDFR